jgi:ABC-2 type transport system permease protein
MSSHPVQSPNEGGPRDAETVPGFWSCLARECGELRRPVEQVALLWLPLAALALIWAIFSRGVAHDLPVAVVDQDGSSSSRRFIRTIDATAGLHVSHHLETIEAGWAALRRGEVYGVVLVPRDFTRDLKRGRALDAPAWYNAQFLPVANVISRELQTAAAGFNTALEARARFTRGESRRIASVRLNPIASQRSSLFNPQLNYGPFLVTALGAAILHIAATLAAVRALGRELRAGTLPAWLESAGGRWLPALAAKFALPFLVHAALGAAMLIAWHGLLGWPVRGSGPLLFAGLLALLAAYYALGAAIALVTANYRMATSVAAFLTAPAVAFGGVTFPLESMPDPAWAWGRLLPLTSFLQLQIEQTARGAPVSSSLPQLMALVAVAAGGGLLVLVLARRRIVQPNLWGKT